MKHLLLLIAAILLILPAFSQTRLQPQVHTAKYFDKTPPLREMQMIPPSARDRFWKDQAIRNESWNRPLMEGIVPLPLGKDPVLQDYFGATGLRDEIANFEGVPNRNSVYPPDTDGDVGPDHYFQMINLSFQIFDKAGNSVYGPADNSTLWQGFIGSWTGTNDGDPILLYDHLADRWVATQFAINTNDGTYWELFAISETGDPTGSYYRYAFQYPVFNDYPKIGVWPDAYYATYNMFGEYRRVAVSAHDREAMLAGDSTAQMVLFDFPPDSEPWSMLPADLDGPPPPDGAPNYVIYAMDDAYAGGFDKLSLWEFKANWQDPQSSTFEEVTVMATEPFDAVLCDAPRGRCVHQPDGSPQLEAIADRLMFRLQYRNFGDHESMVVNHTVDVDGTGHAGIRWYELRKPAGDEPWSIYQQGTYSPDGDHRWMGSIAMNGNGDIALGFSVSSTTTYPSIRYTGRTADAPLGQMTFFEEEIMEGTGTQTGDACRWGDYSMMSVDPADDTTFWFTSEYVKQTGTVRWQTRIAAFRLVPDNIPPDPVTDLTASPATTNGINLQWTATGNDGMSGNAYLYDIRYSEEPITTENFEMAVKVEKTPKPSPPGTLENFMIGGLEYSTLYYLAMKVRDKQFNFSQMSNVVTATTPAAPELIVDEDTLIRRVFPGTIGSEPWDLGNTGGSDIYYEIFKYPVPADSKPKNYGAYADESRDPYSVADLIPDLPYHTGQRGPGDILDTLQNGANVMTGMVWIEDDLYMVDMQSNELYKYDKENEVITDTWAIHQFPFGITWDGNYLWIGDKVGNVYAYNLDGTPAGYSFSCPFTGFLALAYDGNYFLVNFILNPDPKIYRLDETGTVIEQFKTNINMTIWQSVWVKDHYSGHFWYCSNNGRIFQMQLLEGMGTIVSEMPAPASSSYALTHDRFDLWFGKLGGYIYQIDDGINEVNWLQIDPEKATLPASTTLPVTLTYDTKDMAPGLYQAEMKIRSNNPSAQEVSVPVSLYIVGDISLGPDSSFCGDQKILLDPGEGFASYLWSDGSQGSVLLADSTNYGAGTFDFWVEVTDLGGIKAADTVTLVFNDCAGIHEKDNKEGLVIQPNPANNLIRMYAGGQKSNILTVQILDTWGRKVMEKLIKDSSEWILLDIENLPSGIYSVVLMEKEIMRTSGKFVISR